MWNKTGITSELIKELQKYSGFFFFDWWYKWPRVKACLPSRLYTDPLWAHLCLEVWLMLHLWELTYRIHQSAWLVKEECVQYFLGCKQMFKMNCKKALVSGRPKEDAEGCMVVRRERTSKCIQKIAVLGNFSNTSFSFKHMYKLNTITKPDKIARNKIKSNVRAIWNY